MKQWLIINTRIWVMQCLLLVNGSDAAIVRKVQRVTGNGQRTTGKKEQAREPS